MSPVAWGQARWGNSSRRSRPDNVASVPSPEALAKPRAATKVNAFGAVTSNRTVIAGRVRNGVVESAARRRRQQRPRIHGDTKRSSPPAFEAAARGEGNAGERTRSHWVGGLLRRRKRGYKAHNAEVPRDALREVGGGHRVAMKAWTAQPAGAKGLCLSRAYAGGTA